MKGCRVLLKVQPSLFRRTEQGSAFSITGTDAGIRRKKVVLQNTEGDAVRKGNKKNRVCVSNLLHLISELQQIKNNLRAFKNPVRW